MNYQILIERSAEKEIKKLPKEFQTKVISKIKALGQNPRPEGCRKLVGTSSIWRIRIADYRVVYDINDREILITIIRVRHRKEVY